MALMKCPECGTEVSSLAASCPKCAAPISQLSAAKAIGQQVITTKRASQLIKEHTLFSIALIVLGLIIAGASGGNETMSMVGVVVTLVGIVWFLAARRRFHAQRKKEFPINSDGSGEWVKGGQTKQSQISATEDPGQVAALKKKLALETRFRNGIGWFYAIAGLSIVNTLSYLSGAKFTFVIGLGATQFVDGLMSAAAKQFVQAATLIRVIGVVIDLVIAGMFVLFGYLGRKRNRGVIIAGMVLYAADAILLALFRDFLGTAFHAWALIGIWGGLKALGQLQALDNPPGNDVIGTLR